MIEQPFARSFTPPPADFADDQRLLSILAKALRQDEMPDDVLSVARMAPELSAVDGELAELVYDSLADDVTVMRDSAGQGRSLSFTTRSTTSTPPTTLDVDLLPDGCTVIGQVSPDAAADRAIVDTTIGSHEIHLDEHGRFHCETADSFFRIRLCQGPDLVSMTTPWLRQ